jgi:RNA polymerase sigma-70 factor (family 1)
LFTEKRDLVMQLACRLREGDEKAFKEVYHLFFKKIYAFCFSMTSSRETAEDIVQEVFVKLWTNRHNIVPDMGLQAYLYAISRNQVYQYIRSMAGAVSMVYETGPVTIESQARTDERLICKDLLHVTEEILDDMPLQRRYVYLLCKKYCFSYAEVATYLDISVNSVKTHMKLALKTLRDQLAPLLGIILFYFYFL